MNCREFSEQFDVLLNSSFIANDFGEQSDKIDIQLDEYEKSVFLTQAQEQLVINLYNGRNIEGLSFESAEESRRYLKDLTERIEGTLENNGEDLFPHSYKVTNLPLDCLFITKETAKFNLVGVTNKPSWLTNYDTIVEVVPITQDEYHRIRKNPYKKFDDFRILRIEDKHELQLYSKYPILKYDIDYIRKPNPIIVSDLGGLSIDGETEPQTSELNPILHRTILLEAVKLAKIVKQNQIRNEMLGNMPGQLVHPPMQPVNQRPN